MTLLKEPTVLKQLWTMDENFFKVKSIARNDSIEKKKFNQVNKDLQ
jgi:hypothetical protein